MPRPAVIAGRSSAGSAAVDPSTAAGVSRISAYGRAAVAGVAAGGTTSRRADHRCRPRQRRTGCGDRGSRQGGTRPSGGAAAGPVAVPVGRARRQPQRLPLYLRLAARVARGIGWWSPHRAGAGAAGRVRVGRVGLASGCAGVQAAAVAGDGASALPPGRGFVPTEGGAGRTCRSGRGRVRGRLSAMLRQARRRSSPTRGLPVGPAFWTTTSSAPGHARASAGPSLAVGTGRAARGGGPTGCPQLSGGRAGARPRQARPRARSSGRRCDEREPVAWWTVPVGTRPPCRLVGDQRVFPGALFVSQAHYLTAARARTSGSGKGGGAAAEVGGKHAVVAEQVLACLGDMGADELLLTGEESLGAAVEPAQLAAAVTATSGRDKPPPQVRLRSPSRTKPL